MRSTIIIILSILTIFFYLLDKWKPTKNQDEKR